MQSKAERQSRGIMALAVIQMVVARKNERRPWLSDSRPRAGLGPAVTLTIIALLVVAGGASYFLVQNNAPPTTTTSTATTMVTISATVTRTAPPVTQTITQQVTQTSTLISSTAVTSTLPLAQFNAAQYSTTNGPIVLAVAAGKDRGFYSSSGLNPAWVSTPTLVAAQYKGYIGNGTLIGFGVASDVLVAEAGGAPIKLVGTITGNSSAYIAVLPSSPINSVADLDGKRISVDGTSATAPQTALERSIAYLQNKTGIHLTYVYSGNANSALSPGQQVAALQGGTADALISSDPGVYSMVLAGQLRIVTWQKDFYPQPWATHGIWAANSLIQSDPALVKAFVRATLGSVTYLSQNPSYAANLYSHALGVSPAVGSAAAALASLQWSPTGQGTGGSLLSSATSVWNFNLTTGAIPAGTKLSVASAIDTSFLGP